MNATLRERLSPDRHICPTCLQTFDERTVQWTTRAGDPAKYARPTGRRFIGRLIDLLKPEAAMVDWSYWNGQGYIPHCPSNNKCELPTEIFDRPSYFIALVGQVGASKSHFLGSAVRALTASGLSELSVIAEIGGSSQETWRLVYAPLVDQGRVIERTQAKAGQEERPKPTLVRVENTRLGKRANLIFFDVSGEDLTGLATMNAVSKHIAIADMVFFFVPPAAIPAVRRRLGQDAGHQDIDAIKTMISAVHDTRKRGRKNVNAVELPVGVLVSKADQLCEDDLEDFSRLLDPIDLAGLSASPLLGRFASESREVQAYLEEQGAAGIVTQAAAKFTPAPTFMFVSATGCDEDGGVYPEYKPRRCLEAMLLALARLGLISEDDE
jgi:hypothetical protein